MTIRYIDLFAGVGGFHYGLDSVDRIKNRGSKNNSQEKNDSGERLDSKGKKSISTEKRQSVQHSNNRRSEKSFTCVYSNEWDKYANSVYKKHYGECDERDIRTVKAEEIPDHDLICGGFPCQAFSIAGKRGGFEDTRGTLFFEIARIAREKRTSYLFLENVKGLLSHDKGRTFGTILQTLDELGYDVQWQVLNSKNFGVPQNRERVFIIANLREKPRPKIFPLFGKSQKISQTTKIPEQISNTLRTNYSNQRSNETYVCEEDLKYIGGIISDRDQWLKDGKDFSRNFSQGQRVYSADGIASTLAGNAGGLGGKTGLYQVQGNNSERKLKKVDQVGALKASNQANQRSGGTTLVSENTQIRRLTPLECERLQGFPDNWTQYGVFYDQGFHIWRENIHELTEMSDTQRYKMMGNAVTTNVVTEIGKLLSQSILGT